MGFLTKIWAVWLAWPITVINQYLGIDLTTGWRSVAFKVAVIIVVAVIIFEFLSATKKRILKFLGRDDFLEVEDIVLPSDKGQMQAFAQTIEGARNIEKTIAPLQKAKQYDRVAEVYASLNKHKEAAKWFMKSRDRKRAATEWALAGYTAKAAKLLMKEGDFATAARFFEEIGDHRRAALAHEKLGDLPKAAAAYAKAKKLPQAVKMFQGYFASTQDPFETQIQAADACYAVLQTEPGRTPINAETRRALLTAIAARFEHAKRYDVAAALFRESGEPARAGDVYVKMGKLPEAAACLREAGKTKEATLIGARYYEVHEKWGEAGMAYAGGEDFRKAGDCFAKANMAARAAECYERAGEYYGAALAYTHLGSYDKSVHLLQRIKETEKTFDQSRALLGRCFYEMHDYAHCAATLENHLLGKRVESANVDYFYMLALAYEQLDKLEKSQEVLYKIRSVNVEYKDVTQRLSNISSRISIRASAGPVVQTPATSGAPSAPGAARTQIMEMVENLLGGRYELKSEIGRGGMGVVYLAHDTQLDRPVALKFLGTLVDDSEEYRQRFTREAKTAARVNHPNIVSIYDISAAMGKAYIAMEYIDGKSLTRYLRDKERLSPRETANIAMQACSALDAVHKAGIIHRDIKPDNILLTKGGLVKLTDFGLAKAENARMTASHVVMGTPAYMSPEQTRGVDVDARSDVYSMGLVLYEMLTGTAPFTGPDALRRQQEDTPERPALVVGGVPEAIDRIVMKCIDKDPDTRFQTVGDLLAALRQAKE